MVPETLLILGESFEQTYKPVLDFHGWRVAMLRYCDALDIHNLKQVERHNKTNEVFILSEGEADLIIFSGDDKPQEAYVVPMTRSVAYNIPDNVWHHVITSQDAHIILFERTDTSVENSDYVQLSENQLADLKEKLRFKEIA